MRTRFFLLAIFLLASLSACAQNQNAPAATLVVVTQPPQATNTPAATETPTAPTATPEPLAALVNGVPITEAAFTSEVARYELSMQKLAQPMPDAETYLKQVLESMILEELIVQAAQAEGYEILESDVQVARQQTIDQIGGDEAFKNFLASNLYTDDEFTRDLRRSLLITAMQNVVAANSPLVAEQVHARQILVGSQEMADSVMQQLDAGADFATLATQYSIDNNTRFNGGDLDWFPRGTLIDPALEDAVFALEPGKYTTILQTPLGYHILQLVEKQADRELSPAARVALQDKFLAEWQNQLRLKAVVERYLP